MRKLIGLGVSLILLGVIYWRIDRDALWLTLENAQKWWLVGSLGMIIPLMAMTAWRLRLLMPHPEKLSLGEAMRLTLIAAVLNMILPSKMGDIVKAYAVADWCGVSGSLALSLAVYEKAWDMAALLAWCVLALAIFPGDAAPLRLLGIAIGVLLVLTLLLLSPGPFPRLMFRVGYWILPQRFHVRLLKLETSWHAVVEYAWRQRQIWVVILSSIVLWFFHLAQIWGFAAALSAPVPFMVNLALAPLVILAGLLPFTLAGVGTRDAAIIFLYAPYMPPAVAAGLGILCTMRYVIPAIMGIPFINAYAKTIRSLREPRTESR
ncbi:MAG: lysylphosphatidylglycerol synthase transmembrane domain-containing protein [Alphaproteobacteria bacterium]